MARKPLIPKLLPPPPKVAPPITPPIVVKLAGKTFEPSFSTIRFCEGTPQKLLKKIEQAIDRIDAGEYGYCDETGEPIGIGRLLARPTATLTIEAQERRERLQKLYGD